MKEILAKHKIEVNSSVLQEISNSIVQTNPLLLTMSEKDSLSTDHRRNIYFKEHFSVIEPTEYLYNTAHKNSFVYISIAKLLETLLGCADFFGPCCVLSKVFLDNLILLLKASTTRTISYSDSNTYVLVWC